MIDYDPDLELEQLAASKPRLLFYPSSGKYFGRFLGMDYDVFVFADYGRLMTGGRARFYSEIRQYIPNVAPHASTRSTEVFKFGDKWGFLFVQDNNEVLESIWTSGNTISCFLGFNDGCCEGGNYECVNEPKFFERVLSAAEPSGMKYLTDHTSILKKESLYPDNDSYNQRAPGLYEEFIWNDKYFKCMAIYTEFMGQGAFLSDKIVEYQVVQNIPDIYEYKGPSTRITIEHDSIVNHLDELDGLIVSPRCKNLIEKLKPGKDISQKLGGRDRSLHLLSELLRIGDKKKWKVLGTTAFGGGEHKGFFEALDSWNSECPLWIRIFHFDEDDFSDIKELLKGI
jgi:hypothetical protein